MSLEKLQALRAERNARLAYEQMLRDEVEAYAENERRRLAALPAPEGLEDFDEEAYKRFDHRYQKYVDGALRKFMHELTDCKGHRDDTTYVVALCLIELAAADWNDFTMQDAQRFLRTYAPKKGRPYGGPDDLSPRFIEEKWKSAWKTWKAKGCQARERPSQDLYHSTGY